MKQENKDKYTFTLTLEGDGERHTYEGTAEYLHNPNDYGNGYHLGITAKFEPFGVQGYDLRYNREFHAAEKRAFLERMFRERWDGKHGAWLLTELTID